MRANGFGGGCPDYAPFREAAKTVEISLLDHVVVGRSGTDPLRCGFYSFRQAGLL
jgi:hypothetical protein